MNRREFIKLAAIGVGAISVPIAIAKPSIAGIAKSGALNEMAPCPPGYRIIDGYRRMPVALFSQQIPGSGPLSGVTTYNGLIYAVRDGHCYWIPENPNPNDEWKELTLDNSDMVPWPVGLEYRTTFMSMREKRGIPFKFHGIMSETKTRTI